MRFGIVTKILIFLLILANLYILLFAYIVFEDSAKILSHIGSFEMPRFEKKDSMSMLKNFSLHSIIAAISTLISLVISVGAFLSLFQESDR